MSSLKSLLKFFTINLAGAAFIAAIWVVGWLPTLLGADRTGLVSVIFGLGIIALGLILFGRTEGARWLGDSLVILGLIGTAIGIFIAFGDLEIGGGFESRTIAANTVINGLWTAVTTTIAGLTSSLWVDLNLFLCRDDDG